MACSQEEDYKNYCNQMKSWFLKCSCLEHLIDTEMKKASLHQERELKKVNQKGYHL